MSPRPLSPRRLITALVVVAAAGTLAACSTSNAATTSASKPLSNFQPSAASHHAWSKYSFVIGDNGGDGSQALSQLTGVFNKAPYKVTFARFTYGPPLVQAASSGDIDLGSVGDVPPITGAASEYGFSVVGVAHYINTKIPDEDIIVPKGSPIHSLSQLKGKKIAVPEGSSANGLVLLALKSVGLKFSQVHIDYLSPAAGATAFQSGKVDAWAIWNPQVVARGQGRRADHRQGAAAHRPGQQLLRRAEPGPDRAQASGVHGPVRAAGRRVRLGRQASGRVRSGALPGRHDLAG